MLSLANINPNVTSITQINTLCLFLKLSVVSDYNQANLWEKGLCVLCLLDEKGHFPCSRDSLWDVLATQFLPSHEWAHPIQMTPEAPLSPGWPGGVRLSAPPGKTSRVDCGECGQQPGDLQDPLLLRLWPRSCSSPQPVGKPPTGIPSPTSKKSLLQGSIRVNMFSLLSYREFVNSTKTGTTPILFTRFHSRSTALGT